MRCDFHTHTTLSDGELLPIELIRRAFVMKYKAIAVTDHVSESTLARVLPEIARDCALAEDHWNMIAIPGVEITHVPAAHIAVVAKKARKMGAKIIVVHGETPVEPVEPGTNRASVENPDIDILAHPGFVTEKEAALAEKNGVFLEITSRAGHSYTNGHVAKVGAKAGARLLLNTDTHKVGDMIDEGFAMRVAIGAGIGEKDAKAMIGRNSEILLKKIGY